MPSPFQGIDVAASALRAFQRALDVTGNNISNVDTPGYTRETVDFAPVVPTDFYSMSAQSLGQGVGITQVNRIRDAFLDARKLGSLSDLGMTQTLSDGLNQVQSVLNDTNGTGIASALDGFFNAWSALAANPNESSLKVQVQQAGSTLAQRIRNTYAELSSLSAQTTSQINQTFQTIDNLTKQIGDLNSQIRAKIAAGEQPNTLMDQRDQALQKLSRLIDIKTYSQSDGTTLVYSNQLTLVDKSGNYAYPKTFDATASTVSDANGTYDVHGGQLAGLFQAVQRINSYQGQLDTLANTLRTQVNTAHMTGTNSLGTTGVQFFNDSNPQTGAIDFDLSAAVAANAQAISSGVSGNAGDGGLAMSLSQLRTAQLGGLGGISMTDYYNGLIGQVGTDVSGTKSALDTKSAVDKQLDVQIQSTSGVSLDDEMANMLRFQRSYQAAARALSVFDQTTEELIGILK